MQRYIKIAEIWARLLDSKFRIGPVSFGLDAILDLIPGAGDVVGVLLSLYLIWIAYQLRLPQKKIVQMLVNIGIDFLVGLVPFVGAIADIFYKANLMNLKILKEYASIEEGELV